MNRFAILWTAEQAAAYLLGMDYGKLKAAQLAETTKTLSAAIDGGKHTYVNPLKSCQPLALRIEEAAINGDHFPDYLPNRRVKPIHAIRWALAQGDIEVCAECREWYARMVPDAGDPVPPADPPKTGIPVSRLREPRRNRCPVTLVMYQAMLARETKTGDIPEFSVVWDYLLKNPPNGYTRQDDSLVCAGTAIDRKGANKRYNGLIEKSADLP